MSGWAVNKLFRSLIVVSFFIGIFPRAAFSAEDIYYLESEIKENERKYAAIHADAEKARAFLNGYTNMQESLNKAHDELTALEEKMRSILQKNLIKSTIKLGIDTYGKVNLVLGFAQQSAKMIIIACACEYAGDQMQDSFSTPYSKAVKGLSDEARKLAPEIEEVQKTLAMTMDEVKAEAMKSGDKLGDVGAIYRKLYMILEAIEKAKKKIYELRKNLDKTRDDVKGALPQMEEEEKRINERLNGLKDRLSKAYNEKIEAGMQPVIQQSQERSKIAITPIPSGLTDPGEIASKRSEKINQLMGVLNALQSEFSALNQKFYDAVKIQAYDGGFYSPLEYRIPVEPIFKPVEDKDLRSWDIQYMKSEEGFYKDMIAQNKKTISVIGKFVGEYAALEGSARERTTPILNELAGLGVGGDMNVGGFLYSVASTQLTLKEQASTLQEEIDILDKNVPKFKVEIDRRVQIAKDFLREFQTESAAPINAASMVAAKASEVLKEAKAAGFGTYTDFNRCLSKAKGEVGKMFADGATTSQVRDYIGKQKEALIALFEKASKIEHLERLRDNTRSQFEAKYFSDPRMAQLREIVDHFPEEISKDPSGIYSDQYWQYMTNVVNENIREAKNVAGSAYYAADQINDIAEYFGRIDELNKKVCALMREKEYPQAMHDLPGLFDDLNKDRTFLNGWLLSYASPDGKTPGRYKVLTRETSKEIEECLKRYNDKVKAQEDAAAEEERKKQEEERKKKEEEEMERAGYDIYNPRINTYGIPNLPGEMVLVRNDLKSGAIEITGRLSNIYGVSKVLISEDGRVFQELAKQEDFTYVFRPVSEKRYEPVVKLKMERGDEKVIPFFRDGQVLVYRDIDMNVLVAETVKKVADAYEAASIPMFLDQISSEFLGNKTYMEEGVRFDFDMFTNIRLKIFINRIEKRAGMYVAETKWDKTQMVRKTGEQQRTSGQTVMMFVFEDGRMKIKNLRGNLIYATLSPEIAESSGLNQTVVEEIRVARDTRNPVQPGAGQTEESGGVSSITVRTVTVNKANDGNTVGFDLSSGREVGSGAGDFDIEYVEMFFASGSAKIQDVTGQYTFAGITTAPDIVSDFFVQASTGKVLLVQTNEGYYAKIYMVSAVDNGASSTLVFQYAVQTDGSRNLKTQ